MPVVCALLWALERLFPAREAVLQAAPSVIPRGAICCITRRPGPGEQLKLVDWNAMAALTDYFSSLTAGGPGKAINTDPYETAAAWIFFQPQVYVIDRCVSFRVVPF